MKLKTAKNGKRDAKVEIKKREAQIQIREKIPLLDLPWGSAKPWTLVDLWEDFAKIHRKLILEKIGQTAVERFKYVFLCVVNLVCMVLVNFHCKYEDLQKWK